MFLIQVKFSGRRDRKIFLSEFIFPVSERYYNISNIFLVSSIGKFILIWENGLKIRTIFLKREVSSS